MRLRRTAQQSAALFATVMALKSQGMTRTAISKHLNVKSYIVQWYLSARCKAGAA